MRTSFLSRTLIAAASLAIGPAALFASPANAATTPVVTRDMIVAAANAVGSDSPTPEAEALLNTLASRGCGIDLTTDAEVLGGQVEALSGNQAKGLLFGVEFRQSRAGLPVTQGWCVFGALAPMHPGFSLEGEVVVTASAANPGSGPASIRTSFPLAGDVFFTAPILLAEGQSFHGAGMVVGGRVAQPYTVTSSTTALTPPSSTTKKAAQAKRAKTLKAAKKAYTKALKKAGKNKAKRAAAAKAYAKKKAAAKARHAKAVRPIYRPVTTTTTQLAHFPLLMSANLR